jgi:SpoIID/LytB domain protein
MRTPALLVAALLALAAPVLPLTAQAAQAPSSQTPTPQAPTRLSPRAAAVPPDGVLHLAGHGWGHGHGVSQWGSQGGALQGRTREEMLDAYYPGTGQGQSQRTLRVWISTDEGRDTTVWPADGLTVTDLAGGRVDAPTGNPGPPLPTGPAYARWRVIPVPGASGLRLQSSDGATWTDFPGLKDFAGPVRLSDTADVVRLDLPGGGSRDYRGRLAVVETAPDVIKTIDVVDIEAYLRGVVPRESPSSWRPAALQVQAIAARSYASYVADHAPSGRTYDICDSDACQVYSGKTSYSPGRSPVNLEAASTDQAIADTAGMVRTYQGQAIFAQFSSSNGGWASAGSSTTPYLSAHPDPWDGVDPGNTGHSWQATISAADVEKRYPGVGALRSIEVTSRDGNGEWGGRISQVLLRGVAVDGTATQVQASGYGVYQARSWPANADGLRSEWWQIDGVSTSATVTPPAPVLPGLMPLAPVGVLETGSRPLAPGVTTRVALQGVPAGASAVLIAVTARGRGQGTGALLVGPSGGRMVAATVLRPAVTTTGQVLLPLPADGRLALRPIRLQAGVSLKVVGAVVPGGAALAPSSPYRTLATVTAPASVRVPPSTSLLGVTVTRGVATVGGVTVAGAGSVLVSPRADGTVAVGGRGQVALVLLAGSGPSGATATGTSLVVPRSASRGIGPGPATLAVPGVTAGQTVMLTVSSTTPAKVWPAGTAGPVLRLPAGTQVLTVLTLRTGRVLVQSTAGPGRLTVVALAVVNR